LTSEKGSYVLDVESHEPSGTELQPAPDGRVFMPTAWSADGRQVIGATINTANNQKEILSLNLADGAFRTLVTRSGLGEMRSCFLPDRERLVFSSDDKLLVQDGAGGTAREILGAPVGHVYVDVTLSADGRWIAWLEVWDESDIWMAEFQPASPAAAR
jgi:Tol biopolymer transport system component